MMNEERRCTVNEVNEARDMLEKLRNESVMFWAYQLVHSLTRKGFKRKEVSGIEIMSFINNYIHESDYKINKLVSVDTIVKDIIEGINDEIFFGEWGNKTDVSLGAYGILRTSIIDAGFFWGYLENSKNLNTKVVLKERKIILYRNGKQEVCSTFD